MGRVKLLSTIVFAVCLGAVACRESISLAAVSPTADAPSVAGVRLQEIDGDILKFVVTNRSSRPMVVLRDEVLLSTGRGALRREPGGADHVYYLQPGESHDLNVRFDFAEVVAGETVEVRFEHALVIDGDPVAIPPIRIRKD